MTSDSSRTSDATAQNLPSHALRPRRPEYPGDLIDFVEEATIGVVLVGDDGIVRWANGAEYERLGLARDEFIGKPYCSFFASPEEGEDVIDRLFSGETLRACAVTMRHASGETRVVAIDGAAVRREAGWHARLLTRDLTAERRSQAELRRQAAMLSAVGQAVVGTDQNGTVTYWNSAAEELYGWPAAEAIGKSIAALLIPPERLDEADEVLAGLAAGNPWSGEFDMRRRDGTPITAYINVSPMWDDRGNLTGLVGVSTDLSAIKAVQAESRVRQRRLEALAESLPAIVAMASQRQGFFYFNRAWHEFSGTDPQQRAISWADFVHEEDFPRVREAFQLVLHGHNMACEARLRRRDGEVRWFLIRALPLPPSEGESGTAVISAVDITEIKQTNQELESAKNQLETVLRAIADGVTAQDADGRIVYANAGAARILGFDDPEGLKSVDPAELLSRFEIEDGNGRAISASELPAVMARMGKASEEELLKFRAKGSAEERYSLVKAAPVLDQQGNVQYVVDVFRDVTEKVLADREREDLLRRERENRIAAETAWQRVSRLQAITARLANAWSPREAAEAVLSVAIEPLGAASGAIALFDEDGRLDLMASTGYSEEQIEAWRNLPPEYPRPFADMMRSEENFVQAGVEELRERYPQFAAALRPANARIVAAPLRAGGRVLGGMVLGFAGPEEISATDREFVLAVAQQCALAVARTQLYEAERRARRQAQDAEGRYRILAESMPQIVWTATADGTLDYFSPQFYEFTGIPMELGTSPDLAALVHPDDYESLVETWRNSVSNGEELRTESRLRRADGSYCWVLQRGVPVRDAEGRLTRWLGTVTDIDEQKREQERAAFVAEASAILSGSLDYESTLKEVARLAVPMLGDWCAVHMRDAKGEVSRLAAYARDTEELAAATGASANGMLTGLDIGFGRVFASGRSELWPEIDIESLGERGLEASKVEMIRRFGIKSSISVPVNVRGQVMAVVSLATAESMRRYTRRDLETANELARHISLAVENALLYRESQEIQQELRAANEAKDEFLGLMSHELRTPITTLYGGAKILRARGRFLDEEHREALLNDIETEAEGMHRMIEDLLVLARTGAGELVGTEPILANHLVEKVVRGFQLHRPGREVEVRGDPDLLPVMADNTYLEQVLRNLLSNADKYSPPGKKIDVEMRNDGEYVSISVLDRGAGIDAREAELIFTRFYRAERTARGVRGMGLGLTVCKKLVEAQGGSIWARPREGGGTEVGFALPAFTASYDDV
jgi:PAS domain S-box-containing protein